MSKKALAAVSSGTAYKGALVSTENAENRLKAMLPGHISNVLYALTEDCFRLVSRERVYVGVMEGAPGIGCILGRLKNRSINKVWLAPMLLSAGWHLRKDLAGDNEKSWKSRPEGEGIEVRVVFRGLGDIPGVAELFARFQ